MKLKVILKCVVATSVLMGHVSHADVKLNLDIAATTEETPPVVIRDLPKPKSSAIPRQSTPPVSVRSITYQRPGAFTGVDKSMVPGITCPLVENRPHADLLGAIDNLSRHITTTPNCKDNADSTKMAQLAQSMHKSGQALQGYWANPDVLAEDPGKLLDFQKQLENVVTGLSNVGETLSNNALLKTECGKTLTGNTSILLAFSDLATSLAPMALLGASLNPSWSVALKVILGVVGVGSTAKIFSTMYEEGHLDMDVPENRLAVLQNTCEFSRIAQRVRFLKLAQSGQINQVTQEIKMYRQYTDQVLLGNTTDRVLKMVTFRNDLTAILNEANVIVMKDIKALSTAIERIKIKDDNVVCMYGQVLVENFGDVNSFPSRPIANLENLISNQDEMSFDQEFLLKSEKSLRNKISSQKSTETAADIQSCARNTRSYVSILANINQQSAQTVRAHRTSLNTQLSRDKDFAKFQQEEIRAYREVDTLSKIGGVLERLNKDNSVIDKSEMHQQMAALKYALFNTDKWFKSSPVMAWLKHANTMYAESMGRFNKEMASLIYGAQGITKSGNTMPMPPRSDFRNEEYFRQVSQYVKDTQMTSQLANVTLKLAPVGSPQNKNICQHLESAWLEWASALDHLGAQDFFCKTISNLMDQTVEQGIKDHCYGKVDFTGKVVTKSNIAAQQTKLVQAGSKAQAQLVSKKLKELQCEMPDPASALN